MVDFLWIMPFNKKSLQITKAAKHNIAFEHLRKYIFLYVIKFINIPFMSIQNQLKIYMHNKCLFCLFAAYFLKTNCEIINKSIYRESKSISLKYLIQLTEGGWSEGENMRVRNRMWMEWTMVWVSCCCYMCNVPLDSSWLVSLTEEVSASFIISWRENKTYSWIKYSQLQIISVQPYFFLPSLLFLFICLNWVKKLTKLLILQRLVLQVINKKVLQLEEKKNDESR